MTDRTYQPQILAFLRKPADSDGGNLKPHHAPPHAPPLDHPATTSHRLCPGAGPSSGALETAGQAKTTPTQEGAEETPMESGEGVSSSSLPTPVGGGGEKVREETSTHTQGKGNTSGNTSPPTPVGGGEKVREETSTHTQGEGNMSVSSHSPPPRSKMKLKALRRLEGSLGGDGTQSPGVGGTAPSGPGQHAPSPELHIPKWQPLLLQTCMAAVASSSQPTRGCGQVGNFTFPPYGAAPCMQF